MSDRKTLLASAGRKSSVALVASNLCIDREAPADLLCLCKSLEGRKGVDRDNKKVYRSIRSLLSESRLLVYPQELDALDGMNLDCNSLVAPRGPRDIRANALRV